jgi:HPt (histidine-containing phosphotransfer) domain-containing protein
LFESLIVDPEVQTMIVSLGGESLWQEMLQLFLEHAPLQRSEIESAILTKNSVLLEKNAHAMKSSASSLGFKQLITSLKALEKVAQTQDWLDIEQINLAWHEDLARSIDYAHSVFKKI